MTCAEAKRLYWIAVRAAIAAKKLTAAEAKIIARVGSRKERYWVRHWLDLMSILAEREGV